MANTITIPNNYFYIIIALIAVIAIIFILMQWRRVRQSKSQIKYLEKQAEGKKVELVEKDMESERFNGLPEMQQEQLAHIRSGNGKMLQKVGFVQTELNKRITRLETSKEYNKLQKQLEKIEEKEEEIEKKTNKEYKKFQKYLEEVEEREKEIKKKE